MKLNQKGFSAVEIFLVILVVGLLGAVGWLVYDRQKDKETATQTVPTTQLKNSENPTEKKTSLSDEWATLTSLSKKFSISVPDGWSVTNDNELDYVSARGKDNLTYKAGVPATISNTKGFRGGGGHTVSTFFMQTLENETFATYFDHFNKTSSLKTNNGLTVTKYTFTSSGGDMESPKGSITTGYAATKNGTNLVITYTQVPGETDQVKYVEESVKTTTIY